MKKKIVVSNDPKKGQGNISFEGGAKLEENVEKIPSQEVYSESIPVKKTNRDSPIDTDADVLLGVDEDQSTEAVG